ncbi:MAG: DUF29 domain-containing protein [Gloeomargarita sp. HHBFW_bins_162]
MEVPNVDLENLIEELSDLGRSERNAISSDLMRLCEHLLKLQYWEAERQRCYRGWFVEIRNFRKEIMRCLHMSPSLQPWLSNIFLEEYQSGRLLFLDGSGLPHDQVPQMPPFTPELALDEDWLLCNASR